MAIGLFATSGFWFYQNFIVYGELLHKHIPGPEVKDFFYFWKNQRPPTIFLFTIALPAIMPFFGLAYLTLFRFIRNRLDNFSREKFSFLWLWILAYLFFLVFFFKGQEHRYFLPVHPALAILSAYVLMQFHAFLKRQSISWKFFSPALIIIFLLLAIARWTAGLGLETVYSGAVLILWPF